VTDATERTLELIEPSRRSSPLELGALDGVGAQRDRRS
jgi:hypothetical protein